LKNSFSKKFRGKNVRKIGPRLGILTKMGWAHFGLLFHKLIWPPTYVLYRGKSRSRKMFMFTENHVPRNFPHGNFKENVPKIDPRVVSNC
jgi:hypothetical protein